jgi:hypothetical protein
MTKKNDKAMENRDNEKEQEHDNDNDKGAGTRMKMAQETPTAMVCFFCLSIFILPTS